MLRRFVRARLLVALPERGRTFVVHGVRSDLRLARPWTRRFVVQLTAGYGGDVPTTSSARSAATVDGSTARWFATLCTPDTPAAVADVACHASAESTVPRSSTRLPEARTVMSPTSAPVTRGSAKTAAPAHAWSQSSMNELRGRRRRAARCSRTAPAHP
jgi:hypothetical protein